MRVFIAEDNHIELSYFKRLLAKEADITVVGDAQDGNTALNLIKKLKPDVVFLDISIPEVSGIEIARCIDPNTKIVFITAYQDFAVQAFEVGSVDYILKPVDYERLITTLDRIRKSRYCTSKDILPIKIGEEVFLLNANDIIFIEKKKGLKKINIETSKNSYTANVTLNSLESKLIRFGFVRTHKSFLVNTNKIERILPWGHMSYLAILEGTKKEVLISRKYAQLVKSVINLA